MSSGGDFSENLEPRVCLNHGRLAILSVPISASLQCAFQLRWKIITNRHLHNGPWRENRVRRDPMIYELRVYHCLPGRLPALLKRFETVTVRLFERHGIRQLGFWTVAVGESNQDLVYILRWDSLDEREKRLAAFQSDPEWIEARRKSEEDGPLVASITNSILTPTAF